MLKPQIVALVPGDDWLETLTVLDEAGDGVDYSGWTILVADIVWPKGSITVDIDTAQAAIGVFAISAANTDTGVLPYGPGSTILIRGRSAQGKVETIYYATVDGVHVRAVNTLSVTHVGTQGPRGTSFAVVETSAELVPGFGGDGDTAIIRTTGAMWLKAAGAWSDSGKSFWGTLLDQGAAQVELARRWAEEDPGVEVDDGFSARHWADQAHTWATDPAIVAVAANIDDIGTVADNLAPILDAPNQAAAAAASATSTAADVLAANDAKDAAIAQEILVAGLKAGVDTTYAAMIAALASVTNYNNTLGQLTGAAKQIVAAADVVAAIVYDTALDSDGGAWRKRCKATSWFNEGLNTATRGSRTFFPKRALVVARSVTTTSASLTIYDLDDSACPMWMVFNGGASNALLLSHGPFAGAAALNGMIYLSGSATFGSLLIVDLLTDIATLFGQTGSVFRYNGNLAARNAGSGVTATAATGLVNRSVNAVAATVLTGTPVDPVRKLPTPTIAVGTAGGVSVIFWDGRVSTGAPGNNFTRIGFSDGLLLASTVSTLWSARPNVFAAGSFSFETLNSATVPAILGSPTGSIAARGVGGPSGLTLINRETVLARSAIAYVTSKYNTGYMVGDIKMALADSVADVTSLVGATPINDTFSYADKAAAIAAGWTSTGAESAAEIQWDIVGGALQIVRGAGGVNGAPTFSLTGLRVGQRYSIRTDVATTRVFMSVGGVSVTGQPFTVGAGKTLSFVATAATMSLLIWTDNASTAVVDNLRVDLVASDRSVAGNHPRVVGTLTRAAVAAVAELAGISGWSAANYLTVPGIALGAGDWCFSMWRYSTDAANADRVLFSQGGANGWSIFKNGIVNLFMSQVGRGSYGPSSGGLVTNRFQHLVLVRRGSNLEYWIDGVLNATLAMPNWSAALASGDLFIGVKYDGTLPLPSTDVLALMRLSQTAPTPVQIRAMNAAEAPMFQPGAKCLLNGSDNVQALDYDAGTDLLYAAKAANGTDVFKGLCRIGAVNTASENAVGAELVANGNFDADISGWTISPNHAASWVSGRIRLTTINTGFTYVAIPTTIGGTYLFRGGFTDVDGAANARQIRKADDAAATVNTVTLISATGAYQVGLLRFATTTFVATAAMTYIILQVNGTQTIDFDYISVRRLTSMVMASDNHKGVSASNDNIAIVTDAEVYAKTPSIGLREAVDTALGRTAASVPYDRNTILRPGCSVTSNATPTLIASFPMDKGEAGDWVIETVAREYGDPAAPEFALYRDHFAAFRPGEGNITLSGTSTQTVLREVTASMAVAIQVNTTTQAIEVLATGVASKNLEWGVKASFFPVAQVA